MNKKAFLHQLKKGLKGMPKEEVDDILYDYREHIEVALNEGEPEEEVTKKLGSPKKIAKQHRAEFYFNQAETKRTAGSSFRAIIAGVGLSFFNIIFVLPIIFSLYAALIGVFLAFVGVAIGGLVASVAGFFFLTILPASAVFMVGLGTTCLGILLCIAMVLLMKVFTMGIVGYMKANLKIVKKTEVIENE